MKYFVLVWFEREKLKQDKEIHDLINDYNFISNMFKIYVVRELSNYSTVIVMGF